MGPAGVMIEELNNDEDPEVSKQREKIDQLLQKKLAGTKPSFLYHFFWFLFENLTG